MDAVLITPDATVHRLALPDAGAAQHEAIATHVGNPVERAHYHRQAVLHLQGNSSTKGMDPNFTVWALACAWRGARLPYALCGPFVLTGPDEGGSYTTLGEDLARYAEHAAQAARTLYGQPADRLIDAVRAYAA